MELKILVYHWVSVLIVLLWERDTLTLAEFNPVVKVFWQTTLTGVKAIVKAPMPSLWSVIR